MRLLSERQKEFERKFQEQATANQADQAAAKLATEAAMEGVAPPITETFHGNVGIFTAL